MWGGRRAAVSQADGGDWSIANRLFFNFSPDCYVHPGQSDHRPSPCQEALTNVTFVRDSPIYMPTHIFLNIYIHILICVCLSAECGERKAEDPAVEIDVWRNVDGSMECTVDMAGLLVFG